MTSATSSMLLQFEAVFLTEIQQKNFQQLFDERKFEEPNPVFQSWLPLKFASLPTEAEALKSILKAHTPAAIPKQTAKRTGKKVPDGAARFDPVSKEWKEILEEREDKTTPKKKGGSLSQLRSKGSVYYQGISMN